jgi:hypothetical protein
MTKREATLGKLFTSIFVSLVLIVGAGTGSARSGDATFKLTNNAKFSIMVKFFSQNRNWSWPGPTSHWTLSDNGEHDFHLACQDGEKICYGGSYTADDATYWGVGFNGNKGCQDCCLTCGNNPTHSWNLTDAPSDTCAHCNDGSCQCGVGTPDGLCASHGGNDPSLGCSQQQ